MNHSPVDNEKDKTFPLHKFLQKFIHPSRKKTPKNETQRL